MNKKISVILGFLFFLAACASPSGPELIAQNIQEKEEQKTEQIKTNVDNVPKWYLAPPDGKGVVGYFVGQGESASIQVAKDIAVQEAKEDMASAIDSRLSQTIKKFVDQGGITADASLMGKFSTVSKEVTAETQVAGWSLKEGDVQSTNDGYIFYALIEYVYGEANILLQQKIKQDQEMLTAVKATEAFAELEEEIKKAQEAN
jgi:PBP1b-binding outer membrane lipoprotein LpoB